MFLKLHEPNLYQKWLQTVDDRFNNDSSHFIALQQYKSGIEGEIKFYDMGYYTQSKRRSTAHHDMYLW